LSVTALRDFTDAVAPTAQFGIFTEGRRNDGLMRLAGQMRRKGATQEEIEAELLDANAMRCKPSLEDAEVRKVAASAAAIPKHTYPFPLAHLGH